MAGAGYKLFNTGDVLTAAQVNTYLQEQTVMVFADAAARTTALASVLAEGMFSYLKDTDILQYYSGSTWVTVNTDQTPLTTKGDLFTYSTQDARLAVGSNGETLVAISSNSTGLGWQGNYAAGKNAIINGDFRINQRAFTSNTASGSYNFDRFLQQNSGGTVTVTPQTFTAGTAPVAGYEAINFLRTVTASHSAAGDYAIQGQKIEDVRVFANQTITVSFWAKAASGTPKIAVEMAQNFGSGGSSFVGTYFGQVTLSTSWARYSVTGAVPTISGKTIGTSSSLDLNLWVSAGSTYNSRTGTLGVQNGTFDLWGIQVEAGSVATAFQTATGTLAGELAACQRYFVRLGGNKIYESLGLGYVDSATEIYTNRILPVPMRTTPSCTFASASTFRMNLGGSVYTLTGIGNDGNASSPTLVNVYGQYSTGGLTSGRAGVIQANNSTSATWDMSAEL